MTDSQLSYRVSPARYAKGMMAVHCISDGTGWKTVAALIISNISGIRYSNRERAYILSPTKLRKFQAEIEAAQIRRDQLRSELVSA